MNAARDFLGRPRPTGKSQPSDRRALRHLWSLLYRAVRRNASAIDDLERRIQRLEEERRGRDEPQG